MVVVLLCNLCCEWLTTALVNVVAGEVLDRRLSV